MRFVPNAVTVVLCVVAAASCAGSMRDRVAADLRCSQEQGISIQEGQNQLVARGCGKRATYTATQMGPGGRRYTLDEVVADDTPVRGPAGSMPALDAIPCTRSTDCSGTDRCEDGRCVVAQ